MWVEVTSWDGDTIKGLLKNDPFKEASSPITSADTKFGGQPVWLAEPQWPLSRATGNPMRFVCQIVLRQVVLLSLPSLMEPQ